MDILELASRFQKLAQTQPMPAGTADPSKLPAGAYTAPSGEVTIVGDPNAPQAPQTLQQVMEEAGWKNFKVHSYYTPPKEEDRQLLIQRGFKMFPGIGLVPPDEIAFVQQALAKGWKYAGPGYGLLPPEWYSYLVRERYI
jgi:hypothetical protein